MVSEYPDEKTGLWKPKPGAEGENHAWDVSVYQMAAAEAAGIRYWKVKETPQKIEPASPKEHPEAGAWLSRYERPNWLRNR